ncbi:MAG TPA: GNAT family N-acetyltransferase [Thermoplasmata archaeon]|nr:GNAT family N-acetyltransferase [Thermoplasmata archaeon]
MGTQEGSGLGEARPAPTAEKSATVAKAIVVERLTHHDIPEICALYKRVWEPFKTELPGEILRAWTPTALEFTSSMEGVTYFAARRDAKMVGAIACHVSDGSCRILHLAVDADQRRQGVASALAHAAIEWARHSNCHSVWADALAKLDMAAATFQKLGFQECGVFHRHYFTEDVRLFEMVL